MKDFDMSSPLPHHLATGWGGVEGRGASLAHMGPYRHLLWPLGPLAHHSCLHLCFNPAMSHRFFSSGYGGADQYRGGKGDGEGGGMAAH